MSAQAPTRMNCIAPDNTVTQTDIAPNLISTTDSRIRHRSAQNIKISNEVEHGNSLDGQDDR